MGGVSGVTLTEPLPGVGLIDNGKRFTSRDQIRPGSGVCGELPQRGSGREAPFRQRVSYYLCLFGKDT